MSASNKRTSLSLSLDKYWHQLRDGYRVKDENSVEHTASTEVTDEEKLEFKEKLAKLMGGTQHSMFNVRTGLSSTSGKSWGPITRLTFFKLFSILKVKPEDFLLTREEEDAWFEENKTKARHLYFTIDFFDEIKQHWRKKEIWKYFSSIGETRESISADLKKTYSEVTHYYEGAQKHIVAHELLFKGSLDLPRGYETYQEAQKNIYTAIVKNLKKHEEEETENTFRYERWFYPSISDRLFPKESKNQIRLAFVAEASIEALQHVITCKQKYKDNCDFYIAQKGTPYRNQVNIDDEHLLVEDYVSYRDGQGILTVPDRVCVLNVSPYSKGALIINFNEQRINRFGKVKFTASNIPRHINDAINFVTTRINERKEVLRLLPELQSNGVYLHDFRDQISSELEFYIAQLAQLKKKIEALL